MKKIIGTFALVLAFAIFSNNSVVGQSKTVVDVAVSSADHTTLVAAVKAAGLVETLQGEGPFTIFAPTNAAFDKLPKGTVETLLKNENKDQLASILTYHVIAGNFMASDVIDAIKKGNGQVVLTTIQGSKLTASLKGNKVKLVDEKGGKSYITATDLKASNGVIHIVDRVVLPS